MSCKFLLYSAIVVAVFMKVTFGYFSCSKDCGLNDALSNLQQPMSVRITRDSPLNTPCDKLCIEKMKDQMKMWMPEYEDITDFQIKVASVMNTLSANQFQTYCNNIYKPFDDCLNTCNDIAMKRLLELRMAPTKFMCKEHYSDFYQSRECASKVNRELLLSCETDSCLDKKRSVDANKNMADTCQLIECLTNCEAQILQRQCGTEIAKLQKDYVKLFLSIIRDEYSLRGLSIIYPNECNVDFN